MSTINWGHQFCYTTTMMNEPMVADTLTDEAFIERLGPLLRAMSHRMRQHLSEAACGAGLTVPVAMALRDLDPDRPRPMNDLAGALQCDPSHVTGIADRLEQLGLVTRQPALYDRRVKELQVTAAGRQRRAGFIARLTEVPLAIEALDETERAWVLAMLERLLGFTPSPAVNGTGCCPTDEAPGGAGEDCPAGGADQDRLEVAASRDRRGPA